jgi:hypothetical protein
MGGDVTCRCRPRRVLVINRKCNYSAFNGYHRTPSDYSCVQCQCCGHVWRTKAAWVDAMPDGVMIEGNLPTACTHGRAWIRCTGE